MLTRLMTAVFLSVLAAGRAGADAASDAAYQAGLAAYTAADYQGAIKNAEAAVAGDPKNWQAWQLDGNARYALGDKAGAITVYKYALQGHPDNPQLKSFVDSLEGGSAQPAVAAATASPAEAAYQAAVTHYGAADYDNAMKESAEAVRSDPNHWQAWSLLGNCRYARGDKKGALEAYDKSLALHPDQAQLKPFRDQLATDVAAAPAETTANSGAVSTEATTNSGGMSTETSSSGRSSMEREGQDFFNYPFPGRFGLGAHVALLSGSSGLTVASSLTYVAAEFTAGAGRSYLARFSVGPVLVPADPTPGAPSISVLVWAADARWTPLSWRLRPFLQAGYGSMSFSVSTFTLSIGLIRIGGGLQFAILPNLLATLETDLAFGHIYVIPFGFTQTGLSLRYCFGSAPN